MIHHTSPYFANRITDSMLTILIAVTDATANQRGMALSVISRKSTCIV